MKKIYIKYTLFNKIVILVLVALVLTQFFQIVSFEFLLKKNFEKINILKIKEVISSVKLDIHKTIDNLNRGVVSIKRDRSLLASLYFINNYQDKQNYNSALLDEEKKRIANKLLDKVRLSQNTMITLYDKNQELISYVAKRGDRYSQNFISYEKGEILLYSKLSDEVEYKKSPIDKRVALTHNSIKDEYNINEPNINIDNIKDDLKITTHQNIRDGKIFKGHIELIKIYYKDYFDTLSKEFGVDIFLNNYPHKEYLASNLFDKTDIITILKNEHSLYINRYITNKRDNNRVYISFEISKDYFSSMIKINRLMFFSLAIFSMILVFIIFKIFLQIYLSEPIEHLMFQIRKIQEGDYSFTKEINSSDELSVISKNINYLEHNIKLREEELRHINETLEERIVDKTKEQNLLLSLFEVGDSVLFNWNNDESMSIKFVSKSVENLLGYTQSDFESNKISYNSCIHKDDLSMVALEISKASLSRDEFFKYPPYRLITKDQEIVWVLDYRSIVRKNGNIINYIGYINNITKQKYKEQKIIEQSRLAQMGEMISMIAHQWRQPLSAISSTAVGLELKAKLNKLDSEIIITQAQNISKYSQHLSQTINDFRDFFKTDKQKSRVSFDEILESVLNIVETSIRNKNIDIIRESNSQEKFITYANELKQVILNLLKNAEDVLLEREIDNPYIKIITYQRDDRYVIEIRDNGGGVDEDIIDKIFDPYFSTKLAKNGTGLGLYMSKTIIEEHCKGELKLKKDKKETIFMIELGEDID